MAENREVILADFQACTGIDDVGEAILHLDETNWDLLAAINRVMPEDSQQLPSEMGPDIEMIQEIRRTPEIIDIVTIPSNSSPPIIRVPENTRAGTSKTRSNTSTVTFHIHYMDTVFDIQLPVSHSVGYLKHMIRAEVGIPPCQQELHGWKKEPQSDFTILETLDLLPEVTLYLRLITEIGDWASDVVKTSDRLAQEYVLNIRDEVHNRSYKLKFLGTRTVLEVKTDLFTLTDIPVRNQHWIGWPPTLKNDNTMLAQSGISYPEHDLTIDKLPVKENKPVVVDTIDSDSSVEEFEDASETFNIEDDVFLENVQSMNIHHLMPDNVEDETIGTLQFAEQFQKRYGAAHPDFFAGTFEEAIKESCLRPAKERKLLAVYLHHDNSVLANVFCTQLLGFETVLQLLSANFIVWGWDFTHESNKRKFLSAINRTLGPVAALTVRNIDVDTLPVLMIIMRSRSNTEIFTIVQGNVGVNELLTNLIQAVDVFQDQRRADIEVEEERQARERVKHEQDLAYQESLAADRAKEEAKQMQELLEKQEKERAENERVAGEARREAHRQAAESSLPPEPEEGAGDGITKIRVRLPEGTFLERKFQTDTPLQTLLNFLIVEGYPTDEYKVISNWPRRDLTSMDTKLTLLELKLCPQETVILEER
ncbi:FAS-associated factor 1 isoform X1 [Diprion similis]|uniref:FAS-associated factor 1 isoform X1 n=1 Tax=Diprion similis TaxID=362088 RepID=UPI001EF92F6F|nr:FAS-associated factor 1 isoform X1 [Diprion similis]